jgi:hypothetical protein
MLTGEGTSKSCVDKSAYHVVPGLNSIKVEVDPENLMHDPDWRSKPLLPPPWKVGGLGVLLIIVLSGVLYFVQMPTGQEYGELAPTYRGLVHHLSELLIVISVILIVFALLTPMIEERLKDTIEHAFEFHIPLKTMPRTVAKEVGTEVGHSMKQFGDKLAHMPGYVAKEVAPEVTHAMKEMEERMQKMIVELPANIVHIMKEHMPHAPSMGGKRK